MNPTLWGQHYWFVIHVTALKYPEYPGDEDKHAYKELFSELWRFIPCKMCANHYKQHLLEIPIDPYLVNQKTLFEWTVKLHNAVNTSLGKPIMSLPDAIAHYSLPNGGAFKAPAALPNGQQEHALHMLMAVNVFVIVLVAAFMVWMWRTRRGG